MSHKSKFVGWAAAAHQTTETQLASIVARLTLMADLHPLLTKRAGGRDISGLSAYEQ